MVSATGALWRTTLIGNWLGPVFFCLLTMKTFVLLMVVDISHTNDSLCHMNALAWHGKMQ